LTSGFRTRSVAKWQPVSAGYHSPSLATYSVPAIRCVAGQGEGRRLAHHEQLGDERGEEGRARGPLWRAPVGWSRLQFWLLRAQAGPERRSGTGMQGLLTAHARHLHLLHEHLQLDLLRLLAAGQGTRDDGLEERPGACGRRQAVSRPPGIFRGCPSPSAHLRISPRTSNRPHNGLKLPAPGRERSI
jgi:hypothetical protein